MRTVDAAALGVPVQVGRGVRSDRRDFEQIGVQLVRDDFCDSFGAAGRRVGRDKRLAVLAGIRGWSF